MGRQDPGPVKLKSRPENDVLVISEGSMEGKPDPIEEIEGPCDPE
jgi:hypothetical protein